MATLIKKDPIKKARNGLTYAATARCPCGAGLAHKHFSNPIEGHWDCSEILDGTADTSVQHTAQLPFTFYEIKSENKYHTTRPE